VLVPKRRDGSSASLKPENSPTSLKRPPFLQTGLFRLCHAHVFNRKTPGILIAIEFKLEEFITNGNSIADIAESKTFLHLITEGSGGTVPDTLAVDK
jgi:hypothetical protein